MLGAEVDTTTLLAPAGFCPVVTIEQTSEPVRSAASRSARIDYAVARGIGWNVDGVSWSSGASSLPD